MKFNAKKCYIISTEKGGIPFFYTINDHILQYVGENPYLGVTLSEDLTFDAHVGNITKKIVECFYTNKPQGLSITP